MSLIVSYNDVVLPYPMTNEFHQQSVYEDSHTDRMLTKFDITVQCYLAPEFVQMLVGQELASANNPSRVMTVIRDRLMTQRKRLSVLSGGNELIPVLSANQGIVDSKNGPIPEFCNIVELTEDSFLMQYRITAHYWENPVNALGTNGGTSNRAGSAVLTNRWSDSVEYDNCMYQKRSRTGKYIIRSDNAEGLSVDYFRRQMCHLGIPPGFVRESSKYTVTPDGLALEYTVTDKEVYVQPPDPAYEASGYYMETTVRNGAQRIGLVHVKLKGSRKSDRAGMIEVAVRFAATTLQLQGAQVERKLVELPSGVKVGRSYFKYLEHAIVRVGLFDNTVEVTMQSRQNVGNITNKGRVADIWGLNFNNMAKVLVNRRDDQPPPFKLRGEVPLLLQAAAYYDPDLAAQLTKTVPLRDVDNTPAPSGPVPVGQMNRGLVPGEAGRKAE